MGDERPSVASDVSVLATGVVFVVGLMVLGVRLKSLQIDGAAGYSYLRDRQAERRVQTAGARGRILDRWQRPLAENRRARSVVVHPAYFQKKTWAATTLAISNAVVAAAQRLGLPFLLSGGAVRRHVNQRLAMPLTVWSDVDDATVAKLCERADEFAGFSCVETLERVYPHGALAAHALGYVGRGRGSVEAGDRRFSFYLDELRGRDGLEGFYDAYLRGVPGERRMLVDARGFAIREWTVVEARRGPDLVLTLDLDVQRTVERELAGLRGACVVMDSRNGDVLAMASAPSFDLNEFVPVLSQNLYDRLAADREHPLLNRASGGSYAPGSTFKPVTALAALRTGLPDEPYSCTGAFELGSWRLRCTARWGHGELTLAEAMKKSCNPYFSHLAMKAGTNALVAAARDLGLGAKTGIDLLVDVAGVVPDGAWKQRQYGEKWYAGDLAQMGIGQGMLLVSPLQMARVAGALGTGMLARPRLNAGERTELLPVPFSRIALEAVRDGMRRVTGEGGTGWRGADGVAAEIIGKTGTAEIGQGRTRRKNAWFIAYAHGVARRDRVSGGTGPATDVAVALVIENGESGGGTAAPRVRNVLAEIYGEAVR